MTPPDGANLRAPSAYATQAERACVVYASCDVAPAGRKFRLQRLFSFMGPAVLVSVGYMDPGNWATDLEGGARFGYDLIWVLLVSNGIALLLQNLCARLGIISGVDLASGCRREFPRSVAMALWILAELAIIACDLAEVLGSAVALNLLFGLPTLYGAILTSLDVLMILVLQQRGMRRLEAVVLVLLLTIGACMLVEVWLAKPPLTRIVQGIAPRLTGESLYVAIGILGATVMPHNLYLHSALMPRVAKTPRAQAAALRTSLWSTALALNLALVVNASILIVAAATFADRGLAVTDLREVHSLLSPLLGSGLASVLFAVGLLCAGQSATISGTLAGQIVMEGFVNIRLPPLMRRALTRALAIIPSVAVLGTAGDDGLMPLLIGSQIILSLQLPFAVVPLIRLTNSARLMGAHANGQRTRWLAGACALAIVAANTALVTRTVQQLSTDSPIIACLLAVVSAASLLLLGRVCIVPLHSQASERAALRLCSPPL